jgi:hypothetical protein
MSEVLPFAKDYCTNKQNVLDLMARIKQYYNLRGYTDFDVWLSPRAMHSPTGGRDIVFYDIRSSLNFKVPTK